MPAWAFAHCSNRLLHLLPSERFNRTTALRASASSRMNPTTSLVITATPDEYRRVRKHSRDHRRVGNQVLIEATIAEVTLTDELKFGVRWFFDKGDST